MYPIGYEHASTSILSQMQYLGYKQENVGLTLACSNITCVLHRNTHLPLNTLLPMKVFLDTDVLISAFATRGLSADVFRLILVEHIFMTGEAVLEEFERVLSLKFKVPDSVIEDLLNLLRRYHVEPKPEKLIPLSESDPDDQWILTSAVSAQADVLITGDSDR